MTTRSSYGHSGDTNPATRATPGAGLDVLVALCADPATRDAEQNGGQDGGQDTKGWFWLIEMRIHLGIITRCHSVGFAIAPPGMDDLMFTSAPPQGDEAARLLDTVTGYCIANRNLNSVRGTARSDMDRNRVITGLKTMADEPDALPGLDNVIGKLGSFTMTDDNDLMAAMAKDTLCPGLGPVALRTALMNELSYTNHRRDLALIAQDDAVEPTLLGANDNLPVPEVCTEPPSFELIGS